MIFTKIRYLLDSESTQIAAKIATLLQRTMRNLRPKRPKCKRQRFYTSIATNYRNRTTKIHFPDYLFSTGKSYFRNRKVPENSGNDSRYNRCN